MITFTHKKISPSTTRITAPGMELMYLVEGTERAALIDTGSGIGHLGALVRSLTDKPVIVLLTHGHVDHAMGAAEFDEVYINRVDGYVYREHSDMDYRMAGLELCTQRDEIEPGEIIPAMPIEKMHPMSGGDSFAIGGLDIDIYSCPGHTRGSVVMLLRQERTLLLGDACNYGTFMHEWYSTSIAEYERSLLTLREQIAGKFDRIWLSHGSGDGDTGLIDGVLGVCRDIMEGRADDVPFAFKDSRGLMAKAESAMGVRADGGVGNIVYNRERVF